MTIGYDKAAERLHLAATITPELLPLNDDDRPNGAVADVWSSGGGMWSGVHDGLGCRGAVGSSGRCSDG